MNKKKKLVCICIQLLSLRLDLIWLELAEVQH